MNMFQTRLLSLVALCSASIVLFGQSNKQQQVKEENVVIQMNYCINSLTNIVHNKSMSVLEHESDQLVNNLTMEQIIGLPEIRDFRIDLMDAVSKFEITEEERALMRRVQSIKRDNQKWAAISNALNPTMLLLGNEKMGPQLAFQALLTVARSVVEYQSMKGEQNIDELQAMWELRKEDLNTINDLRKSAQGIIFDLYNKYNLKESDRLTESTSNLFSEYISEPNASKRVRVLEDNADLYKSIPDYYYHLGMAYLDTGNFTTAKKLFLQYLDLYKRTPFLRYDERSGCIALAMLTYDKDLSATEKIEFINTALKNMPNNSAAVLQCAMVYIYDLKTYEEGFKLLRSGIDNHHASDRDLLLMAAANLLPLMRDSHSIYGAIADIFNRASSISYDSYLTYLIFSNKNAWISIKELNSFSECYYRKWYTAWFGKDFSSEFSLTLPGKVSFNYDDFSVYDEEHNEDGVIIKQLQPTYKQSVSEKEINKVDCFKANKNLKFLYLEVISNGSYRLKQNVDIKKIKDETWPRQSEFALSQDDIDDIVDFCEDHSFDYSQTEITFAEIDTKQSPSVDKVNFDVSFKGKSLVYNPYHSKKQRGHFVRIVLNNGLQIVYKYDNNEGILIPYYYYNGNENIFWNDEYKNEYTYQEDIINKEESSWWSNAWASMTGWFSSDDEPQEEKTVSKEEESSWWNNAWASMTGWFSSDDDEPQEEKTVSKEEESSWWSNAWASMTGWFSSDESESNS